MHRIVTGATGLIGKRLVEHWLAEGHRITVVGRREQHIQQVFDARVQAITWEHLTRPVLESAEVIVNLAGASIGEKRWSESRQKEIVSSRIEATKKIAELLAELGRDSPPLFNASAIGIYGLQHQVMDGLPAPVDESAEIDWDHAPDFLSFVGRQWEKAAGPAVSHHVRVVFLRFGVVLAKEGGALPQIVRPFRFFVGGPMGTGRQPFSWVAIDDLIRAIDFLFTKKDAFGPFNIVAPGCITQRALASAIGEALHRPALIPTPALPLKWMLGEKMAHELLLEGQHVYPRRLLDLGFHFEYPDIQSALNHLYL